MMKNSPLLLGAAVALLVGCEPTRSTTEATSASSAAATSRPPAMRAGSMTKNGLTLTPLTTSPKMPEAQMQLLSPPATATLPSGEVAFDYQITNFQLTKMSDGMEKGQMANSMKGQHIHNIVDNAPYTAHYTTKFSKPLADGPHAVLSFLSRSYHESLKHRGAYDLRIINVGDVKAGTEPPINVRGANLFYSRPKDTYAGADAKRILLDFYLVNTILEPGGNNVRATINGTEFMLDKWQPYQMEGLPVGENTVKLELVDSSGAVVPGAYNSVTRTFTVTP